MAMRVTHRWNETGFDALQGTIIRPILPNISYRNLYLGGR